MRARFLLPGIALAAFAATLAVIGRPDHGFGPWHGPALPPSLVLPAVPARATAPTTPSLGFPAANGSRQDAPAPGRDEASIEAPQPPLPDPSALPSYESDQVARNANPLRSARTR